MTIVWSTLIQLGTRAATPFAALVYRLYIVSETSRRLHPRRATEWTSRILERARQAMVRRGNPVVRMGIGEVALDMRLSHQLPLYFALFPTYDRVLPRIARQMRAARTALVVIDVGANVGDTAALVAEAVPDARFLCVEGSTDYAPFLRANVERLRINAECVERYCGDDDGLLAGVGAQEQEGTGRLMASSVPYTGVPTQTLDRIVEAHPAFARPDLLKVDTDGYDAKVLRGSRRLLADTRPVLFFEVAPHLLGDVGDDVAPIFLMISALGYARARVYDHEGVARATFDVFDPELLREIERVSLHGASGYCDVLAWEKSWSPVLESTDRQRAT